MDNSLHFVASSNYLKSQSFHVRPLRDVEEIMQVREWLEDYRRDQEGPMSEFLAKAKKAIRDYDTRKEGRKDSGPMSQRPAQQSWNGNDQVIIQYLIKSLWPKRSNQEDPYDVGRTALLQALSSHKTVLNEELGYELLLKFGVLAPWQNPWEMVRQVNPTSDFTIRDPLIKAEEKIAQRSLQNKATAGAVLGPEDYHPTDPLESVRHDFGDMKVFVIDDATAQELDDGISIERIPSEPGSYWVHTHIADPGSIIHPGHRLSLNARNRGSTLYLSQTTIPLFPKSLVHHPILGMSLGQHPKHIGDRVLTFSAKVDMNGNIHDHKVRAGIIRNTCKVTYDHSDDAMGLPRVQITYPFGNAPTTDATTSNILSETDVGDLTLLRQLMEAQIKKRISEDFYSLDYSHSDVKYLTSPPEEIQSPSLVGSVFEGYPDVRYSVYSTEGMDQGSRMMIAEMMKLASRVASRVAVEHDTLMIRRALQRPIPASEEALEQVLNARSSSGYVSAYKFRGHFAATPSSYYTLQPKGHGALGVPDGEGYSRATSPLRRFEDLVAHWTLHHILLGSRAPARPPFSPQDMEQLCIDIATVDKTARNLQRSELHMSALMFIKRWMAKGGERLKAGVQDPLSKPFEAYKARDVRQNHLTNQQHCIMHIPGLGLQATAVSLPPGFADAPISSVLNVRVKGVVLGQNDATLDVIPI